MGGCKVKQPIPNDGPCGTMPAGPRPVNEEPLGIWLFSAAKRPRLRFRPSSLDIKTAHEYGFCTARRTEKRIDVETCACSVSVREQMKFAPAKSGFLVDNGLERRIYTRSGAPSAFRRDCAPLKLLTGTVKPHPTVLGCMGF